MGLNIYILQPDLYTRYLRSCTKKKETNSKPDIKTLLDKVDGIYTKIEGAFKIIEHDTKERYDILGTVQNARILFLETTGGRV